jgi:hypothetical protein
MDRKLPAKNTTTATTMNNVRGPKQQHDEDDVLLAAALGLTTNRIENMETYEENVIRDAELSSTPRLMMSKYASSSSSSSSDNNNNKNNHNDDSIMFGFPPLHAMVPSSSSSKHQHNVDVSIVQKVLEKLRRQNINHNISPTETTTKDYLKEQMLLSLLHSTTNDTEMCVRPQQEAKQELLRKKQYRTTGGNKNNNTQQKKRSSSRNDDNNKDNNNNNNNNNNHHDDDDPSNRLEAIKKGKRVVRFSTDIPAIKILSPAAILLRTRQQRQRKSMQERRGIVMVPKKNDNKNNGYDDDGHDDENTTTIELTKEEIEELERRKEQLKQRRIEREKRRGIKQQQRGKKRTKQGNSNNKKRRRLSVSKQPKQNQHYDDEEEEGEFEYTGEEETTKKEQPNNNESQHDNDAGKDDNLVDHSASTSTTPPINRKSTVVCPLCQESIPVDDADEDAILAQHMNSCQIRRPTRGRNNKTNQESQSVPTAASRSGRSVKRPNYAEDDISFDRNSDDDDESAVGNDEDNVMEEKEDEESGNLSDSQMDDSDIEIVTGQASSKQSRSSHLDNTASAPPSAVDDWDENYYEDRVDDWIENGLSRMRVMKEQDEDETPPGKCCCHFCSKYIFGTSSFVIDIYFGCFPSFQVNKFLKMDW